MARKLRVQYPGAIYHVMNRGDRREPIFKDDADRERFLATLGEACVKTGWQVQAYCLIHMLIIEGRAVVAFEEQRWAVLPEQAFELGGDLAAIEPVADQWPEAVTGAQVLHGDDLVAVAIFGGVTGSGQAG